jgi:hypothetical protein
VLPEETLDSTAGRRNSVERIEFDLEEYRALRSEIIQSIDDGNKIIAFGLAAIGLVFGAGLRYKDDLLGFLILGFFLPVLSALMLSMWFTAHERMARASHYLSGVEARIKSALNDAGSVSWEAWLRGNPNSWPKEHAGIWLFGFIIACSIFMGLVAAGGNVDARTRALVIAVSFIICVGLFFNVCRRYKTFQRWLSKHYDPEKWETHP